ncbi:unnamed protein product, partial [Mesorhabditis belari]|uniref:Non-specific serine/threonine protein kinase n=1 Tax=Mesorhabditis belari TaxID=2138241 RepID=A0AAF3F9K0_9BILA
MREELRRQTSGEEPCTMRFNETPFDQVFEVGDELGSGQFAIVSVLKAVSGHSNVVELIDVYETPGDVILVLELVSGGELFDHVCEKEYLDEVETAAFIKQILLGIHHLHAQNIVHLDIKPENVMLKKKGEAQIKIIDFGLSRQILPGHLIKDMVGTPEFVAPEVVNYEPLSPATDMWALGVLTYILLSGGSPFLGDTRDETFCNITGVNYHFTERYFKNTSPFAKDFISRLFVRDAKKRATVEECLRHPWIRGPDGDDVDVRKNAAITISQIQAFKTRLKWRKAIDLVLVCLRTTKSVRLAMKQAMELGRSIETRFDKEELVISAILIACEEGNLKGLNQLSNLHRLAPNAANKLGESALHVAAGSGHLDLVHYLHMKGAELSPIDKRGDTPLAWASRHGHSDIVNLLASEGADVNCANMSGETPLHVATRYVQMDVVQALLARGADQHLQDGQGETPLHIAAWHGYALLLSILCAYGPPLKLRNKIPLHGSVMAAYLSDPIINPAARSLNLLTINGVDQDFDSELKTSPISPFPLPNDSPRPRAADHVSSLYAPLKNPYPSTSTFIAMVSDMHRAFDNEEPLCCGDDETSLHCAAARGHLECVTSLLDAGAPVDALDQTGQTALHLALRRGHVDIALLLITRGCSLNERDQSGDTALHLAARSGLLSAVQTLCHCGVEVDVSNNASLSPLHVAAKEGHIEVVRVLCLARASINKKTKDGLTAEIIALAQEHTHVGSLLGKMKNEATRELYVEQLCSLDVPLRRIKLKMFGHSTSGKTRLVQALASTRGIGSFIDAVSRRFSDNIAAKDEGLHSGQGSSFSSEANNNASEQWSNAAHKPLHGNYTRGIDVQTINAHGCGEFSVWEFGGYEPYHMAYDHFVGNTDCVHVILYKATDSTEIQYKQVLYWMNFLKGRVTPSEPIGHCGIISRRSKVVIVGSHATNQQFPLKNFDGEYQSSDTEAMLKTVRLRFETHFDIYDKLILLDSTNPSCAGMKALRKYLTESRTSILSRLQKPLGLLDATVQSLQSLRKQHSHFPVVTWPHFSAIVRNEINPLSGDSHCRQLIQQLQLIGEVVYLRDETAELDYVVLNPEWLGTHVIGQLLSAEFLSRCRITGCYSLAHFAPIFPEITEPADLLHILDTLQLCAPLDSEDDNTFEFPAFILLEPPKDVWMKDKPTYVYGGVRVLPMRGMERSLQSTFPRIQVALRRSMHDFQDPMDADLVQWAGCSKMSSGQMEALIRLHGDAVEICVRGPSERATSCFYFLEDVVNLVEQTASEVAPGIGLERHFLSPKHLADHVSSPASFPPESMMAMQQAESLRVKGTHDLDELFTDVVCFGSREVARLLTLGIDVGVADLQLTSRCELAALLDPPDAMGRDWSILAVKLNLTDQVPEVDSTGQSLSRTDQLLAEWAIQHPEQASVGKLCTILAELGRQDARDALYRTVPLYLFAPLDEAPLGNDCADSGVVSSNHSSSEHRSASTVSR